MFHSGNTTRDLDFKFGDNTDVNAGCAALFKGKMMYFGGYWNERQVSLLEYVFYSYLKILLRSVSSKIAG